MALEEGEPYKAMKPKVSICVPNLNTRPFLPERFETIFSQSFQDWELLVYDSYSEDGAWEYIQELAAREERMRIWQGPRQGIYGSWNPCIHEAKGEYVYIATSDDTMALDCLEKLVAALEQNKDCDLAHCPLAAIDETGAPFTRPHWPQHTVFGLSDTSQLDRPHVRRAPYDGLLQLTRRLVYLSITQLLIRRSLFSRIGGFSSKWGPCGDFNWYMKAGLVANVAHVPDTWATWRVHPKQATDMTYGATAEYQRKVEEMILDAVATCEAYLPPAVLADLKSHWLDWTRDMTAYNRECRRLQRSGIRRRIYQLTQVFNGTAAARYHMVGRFLGRPRWPEEAAAEMRRWLESLGLGPMIVPAQPRAADRVESLSN